MVDTSLAAPVGPASLRSLLWGSASAARESTVDLVVVQDDSASMCRADDAGPGVARLEAVRLAVSLLGPGARVGFVAFGAARRGQMIPLRRVRDAEDRRGLMAGIVAATYEKGGTDYGDGLRSAIDALMTGDVAYGWRPYCVPGRTAGVLLVSDGRLSDPNQLRELRERNGVYDCLRQRGVPVFTIGVGSAAHEPEAAAVLREMAVATGGRPFLAPTPGALLGACTEVVAQLSGRDWTADRPEQAPMVRFFDLGPGLREATFVAVKSAEDMVLRIVDADGKEVRCVARTSEGRFEHVTVADPGAGSWSAMITGAGEASVGLLTSVAHGLPAGRGGLDPGAG